ncbi:AAA family ATPase [Pararhizobium sp. LjRoot235]|uniref:ATP-dependent nuclease n=1 Tax=Pararhizobium sp. LjRoot235 TaxID=3342291 RepID=UPI003ECE44A8
MKLLSFRIQNYRSINDSGPISVDKITSLVGRNESGKSNLLLGLRTLNPPEGAVALKPIKDFPRHRRLSECTDATPVVETEWELSDDDQAEIIKIFPRARDVTKLKIGRSYKENSRWVELVDLKPIEYAAPQIATKVRKIAPVLEGLVETLEEASRAEPKTSIDAFAAIAGQSDAKSWATTAGPACTTLRKAMAKVGIEIPETDDGVLSELEELAATINGDDAAWALTRTWAIQHLPVFVYVSEYPELSGHQDIASYVSRMTNPGQLTDAELNFAKMCAVAGLDPIELHTLHGQRDHETRNQLTNRASAVVTTELRRLWKDRELKVRFSPDGDHLDTFISDPNTTYDVEVNLDERSRGLKWFFSFYITFSADTKGGHAENAILLLDEPGLYLHALSQGDLLRHLEKDFANQIIYTTHSPFMVPAHNVSAVRTVNISQEGGTTVTDTPTGDTRTLFPLQVALGYSLSQSLFVGTDNLVVEGVTDYWILSSVAEFLSNLGKPSLPREITITPAGGAQKVSYMVALLSSEKLRVVVLLDDEKQSRATRDELVKARLIRDDAVLFASTAFPDTAPPSQSDIEDIIDPAVYEALIRESYSKELEGKKLALNTHMPRIVKRFEEAFAAVGLDFNKTRVARLFLMKMASEPASVLPQSSIDRFEKLFAAIGAAHAKATSREFKPFS